MTNSYQYQYSLAQERFALRLTARLSDAAENLPYDISERLRAARTQALGRRKIALRQNVAHATVSVGGSTLAFGNDHLSGWGRLAAALPMLALVIGLIAITVIQNDKRANEIAEIDAALLTDDLPPAAYADPGFLQFLKISAGQNQ